MKLRFPLQRECAYVLSYSFLCKIYISARPCLSQLQMFANFIISWQILLDSETAVSLARRVTLLLWLNYKFSAIRLRD